MTRLERNIIHELRNIVYNMGMAQREEADALKMGFTEFTANCNYREVEKSIGILRRLLRAK